MAGWDVLELADRYGTPLYLYDAATIRQQAARLTTALEQYYPAESEITYAAKAYFAPRFAQKIAELGIGVDVVSLGELHTARRAGFAPQHVHLHGNNKNVGELQFALDWKIQSIVVDNLDELQLLDTLTNQQEQAVPVWLRISPDVHVHTHQHLQTAHAASKFGFSIADARRAIVAARASRYLNLVGMHTHLGSQFFQPEPYREALLRLLDLAAQEAFWPQTISPGGGWGVPYLPATGSDDPLPWIETVSTTLQDACSQHGGMPLPRLVVEPGRWLVARSGVAVYRVGAVKTAPDGKRVVAVDGGMADNPRPALYGAHYTAFLAHAPQAQAAGPARIVGSYCESGDELISSIALPEVRRGDVLVIPVAGAYQLSMASNYNLAARPAALWLEEAKLAVLQPRETILDGGWWD